MIEVLSRLGFRPRACVWELTLLCNLQCKHCGSFAGPDTKRDDELSLDEALDVADQLAALGCERVTLGGGEPTTHPNWHKIGRRLTDHGIMVNMISNGWQWGEKQMEMARHARLSNVAFSVDGFEEQHDYQRREGSFKRVMAAIELCQKGKLPVAANTTINTLNCNSLPELRTMLGEKGVFSWQTQFLTPAGTATHNADLVVDPKDLVWLVPKIGEMRIDGKKPMIHPGDDVGYYGRCETALRDQVGPAGSSQLPFWLGCRAGCQVIGLESNGNIKGCLSLPSAMHGEDRFVEGNIRKDKLSDIWCRDESFAYNRGFTEDQLAGFCAVCRFRQICRGGCTWTAYSHTKNRFDNPYCFYREAVKQGRDDLLDDPPTDEEKAYFTSKQADK